MMFRKRPGSWPRYSEEEMIVVSDQAHITHHTSHISRYCDFLPHISALCSFGMHLGCCCATPCDVCPTCSWKNGDLAWSFPWVEISRFFFPVATFQVLFRLDSFDAASSTHAFVQYFCRLHTSQVTLFSSCLLLSFVLGGGWAENAPIHASSP